MMGTHHAISGAAAWVAITSTAASLPTLSLYPLGSVGIALGAVVCAGAALLPDADHHSATIAQSLPGVGRLATSVVSRVTGGHRNGTHSALAAFAVLYGAIWLSRIGWSTAVYGSSASVASAFVVAALLAFSLKVLNAVKRWSTAWTLGAVVSIVVSWLAPTQWEWLPLCIAVGWITHLAGDFLTTGGLPLLWPLKPKAPRILGNVPVLNSLWSRGGNFALPILGNTGSWREWFVMVPLALYAAAGVVVAIYSLLH
ncbi:metal-dependent hydrolase [Leifsonia sp. A12D58]|uniref:metal-dependent hydrolase n=1 Tax=Leifsonia sp. A12D58 TaxID=3397674 RepID=UPI0039E1A9C4